MIDMSLKIDNYQLKLREHLLFKAFSLQVDNGGIAAIMGPSGSGKSTILSDILGTLPRCFVSNGTLNLNNQDLRLLPMEKRNIGILFQDDLLFPHLNVYENLIFGLPNNLSKLQKKHLIEHALNRADLESFQKRDIATLSGGQRSRISLLRTLLSKPELMLLDEPFSKLDKKLRESFRQWVFDQLQEQSIPAILVTHDQNDIPENAQTIELETLNA